LAKMPSQNVKRKRFLMLVLHCILLEKHCRYKQWNCWQKNEDVQTTNAWIRHRLVREPAAEDIGEFQVMFLCSHVN